jgi:MFS transporter, putative metabolite:H+ symporter
MDIAIDPRIAARIDRLPISRWHWKIAIPIGTGWFFDAFDALTIAFILPVLIGEWKLQPAQIGLLIAGGYLGQIIGSVFFGWLAERIGRAPVTICTLLIYGLMSFVAAFSWSFTSLFIIRFIQGLGLGGEIPVMATYVNEWANAKRRGRFALLYQWVFAVGILCSALLATWVVPHWGWQWMFVIGAVPALFALPLRRLLPESPRWLANRGRLVEADRILSRVEAEISQNGRHPLPPVADGALPIRPVKASVTDLFRGIYLKRTISVWIVWFCTFSVVYGLSNWMPSVFRTVYKASVQDAIQLGFLMAALGVAVAFVSVLVIDYTGRRPLFAFGLLAGAVPLFVLAMQPQLDVSSVRILVLVSAGCVGLLAGSLNTYTAELYPTELRALGVGLGNAWLRLASVIGPTVIGLLLPLGGITDVYLFFGCLALLGFAVMAFFCTETKGRMLEELSPSLPARDLPAPTAATPAPLPPRGS